jgi:hypothetical protein
MHTTAQPTIWEVPDDVWTMIEAILNCCGLQTSLAWLAHLSCRGLKWVDTIRTCGLTCAAHQLTVRVTGSPRAVEGSPSRPMTTGPLYGRQTFYSTPPVVSWQTRIRR